MGISSALGSSALLPAGLGFRNMVINGNMAIDQRNSGASVTAVTSGLYSLDRWGYYLSASSKMSIQRLTSTPPAGFAYYQRVTSLAATADTAGAYYTINQVVEGFNSAQLSWGTANAKPAMLSFWVRSSLTGTFGGALRNAGSGGFYTYSFTYTINSANTWEYKTVSIPGSTAGTWATDNGAGIYMFFDMGCNSSETQAAGAWNNVNKLGANGCTRLIGTNGATWDITGVQLEQNYQATPFEQRPIGVELQLCQRYYERLGSENSGSYGTGPLGANGYYSSTNSYPTVTFKVSKCKSEPSIAVSSVSDFTVYTAGVGLTPSQIAIDTITSYAVSLRIVTAAATTGAFATTYINNTSTAYLAIDSEL